MARVETQGSDLHVGGTLSCTTFSPPASCITNAAIIGAAGIVATKLEHQFQPVYRQASGAINADATAAIHVGYGATGDIIGFRAGNITAATGSDTTTVDLKKNGTTVLSAVITLNTAASTTLQTGTLSTTTYVAGDVFTVVIDATGVAPGQGVWAQPIFREDAA
jgi:hypothetical protein